MAKKPQCQPSDVRMRPATPDDMVQIERMVRARPSWAFDHDHILENPDYLLAFVVGEDTVVGFAMIAERDTSKDGEDDLVLDVTHDYEFDPSDPGPELFIDFFLIRRSYREQKLGTAAFECIKAAIRRGTKRIITLRADTSTACAFWKKMGFKDEGTGYNDFSYELE